MRLYLPAAVALLVACSAPPRNEDAAGVASEIVGETLSKAADDAVVQLHPSNCTATLIAPDLLVTARHCVNVGGGSASTSEASPTEDDTRSANEDAAPRREPSRAPSAPLATCGPLTPVPAPRAEGLTVTVGAPQDDSERIDARGVELFVPEGSGRTTCSTDIALLRLDRKIKGAKTARVRLTPVAMGETGLSAVGFGRQETEGDQSPVRLRRNHLQIEAMGPSTPTFQRRGGETITYTLPAGDLATGESTCDGDSGGPLFDAKGRLVAVTSRGLTVANACEDAPALWTSLAHHADLVRRAAASVGLVVD